MFLYVHVYMNLFEDIMPTHSFNVHLLEFHFYILKLGFTKFTLFFIFAINTYCGYSLEPTQCGVSNLGSRTEAV